VLPPVSPLSASFSSPPLLASSEVGLAPAQAPPKQAAASTIQISEASRFTGQDKKVPVGMVPFPPPSQSRRRSLHRICGIPTHLITGPAPDGTASGQALRRRARPATHVRSFLRSRQVLGDE